VIVGKLSKSNLMVKTIQPKNKIFTTGKKAALVKITKSTRVRSIPSFQFKARNKTKHNKLLKM
jgi:hypothetical protein